MVWPERRAGVELSLKCFVRIISMLAVQWHATKRAWCATVLFIHHCDASTHTAVDRRLSSHGETANGAAASAKSELVTYAYYVSTFKYYPPAIYHGQGLARYGRMGSD